MTEPLFSDSQKTRLAQQKVLYEHNLAESKKFAQCSLNAASALLEILQLLRESVERIRSQKEMVEVLTRLQANAHIELQFCSSDFSGRKTELSEKLKQFEIKTKGTVTRLRKSVNK